MARTTAPLLSWGASGSIAKTQTYSKWKGRPYVRRYTIPSNPKTADQSLTRNTFKWLNNFARYLPAGALDAWTLYANNSQITVRNAIIKENLHNLRSETDLSMLTMSPSAGGGLVAAGLALTAGANQITADVTAPDLPTGWTITEAYAMAIQDQNPQSGTEYVSVSGTDLTAPYSIVLTGLTSAVLYQVGAWFKFTKPDGSFAYGISLLDSATPT